ncbi:MAG: helix-turn-helix transcriptional regulator [Lachnospiraceae bacterium]|nr:helix-turn-helix transcriptional regulator [Lachnospiraceae bacterium]
MTISERIFKFMEERGISQIDFSRKTGISQSTISDWKRKKTNPSSDKIMIICDVLEVTPYEILQDTVKNYRGESADYIIVSKGTQNYDFVVEIDSLDEKAQDRLRGYIAAIKGE